LELAHERQVNLFFVHIGKMMGHVQILDANLSSARATLTESLTMLQKMSLQACLAHGLEAWARLLLAQGETQRTARLLAVIHAHLKTLGAHLIPIEHQLYNLTLEAIRQQLDQATFNLEWAGEVLLRLIEAIELAIG